MYNVLQLKNDLSGTLHGTTTAQIQNLDGLINRAARTLLLDVDPQETKRVLEFSAPIFNSVVDYPISADVKGNKLVDIRPQVRRLPRDIWSQGYNQAFDIAKQNVFSNSNMFTMNFDTGIKTVRINAPYLNAPTIINQIEAISTNGTWSAAGLATSLAVNNSNFVQGSGSLQFNAGLGTSFIQNSTMSAVDLTSVLNQSSMFVWVYVPTGSNLTSVELRWGSSASNYYAKQATQNQQGVSFVNGWNLCQFEWSSATVVGSPNPAAISYASVGLLMAASATAVKVNGLNSILGSVLEYEYYSKYMFRDASTGAFQETVTDDSNLINLDTESYNLLFNMVAALAAQQQQGKDAQFDGAFFMKQYQEGKARYMAMYKSEVQKPQTSYYGMPTVSNSRFYNGGTQ